MDDNAPSDQEILAALNRAKVAFQLRAITAAMGFDQNPIKKEDSTGRPVLPSDGDVL